MGQMNEIQKREIRHRVSAALWAPVTAGAALLGTLNTALADVFSEYVNVDGNGSVTVVDGNNTNAMNMGGVVQKYQSIATVITGILTVTMFIFMLIQFTKLGAAGDNESARKKAINGILTTGIATALLGGATIIIGFFWNFLGTT
jgi:hypothetical protein